MKPRMDFMKRALQRQREEARQEAQKLIQALQEEKEFDEEAREDSDEEPNAEKSEKEEKGESEESSKAAAIREALAGGVVRRTKREGKSLEVKDPITIKPLFEAPAIPSMFEDVPAQPESTRSHLVDELSEAESEEDAGLLEEGEANEATGENPWLAAAQDNVSHRDRGQQEEEDGLDVQAAVTRLEVGKLGKLNG